MEVLSLWDEFAYYKIQYLFRMPLKMIINNIIVLDITMKVF